MIVKFLTNHNWPIAPEEHMWSDWFLKAWDKPKPPIYYRRCVHPKCNAFEESSGGKL